MVALRLAKAGYYGGDPGRVKDAPVDDVLNAFAYEGFVSDYESVEYELNRVN